jgi:hypothetical protein
LVSDVPGVGAHDPLTFARISLLPGGVALVASFGIHFEWDYNPCMARGWESKTVEEQIGAAEAKKESRSRRALTADEIEHLKRKEALLLERARIVREMERAYMRRHLVILERGLAHIESELAKLEQSSSS